MTRKQARFLELLISHNKTHNNFSAKEVSQAFDIPLRQVYYYLKTLLDLNKIICHKTKYGADKYTCVLPKYTLTSEDISILIEHKKNQKHIILNNLRSEISTIDTEISALKVIAALR